MKTIQELHDILSKQNFCHVDAHIHTHRCDGLQEMTVENIANKAIERGMTCIILTPHFHKLVMDETDILYTDTDEIILLQLREEIEKYHKKYRDSLTILLSTEADILHVDGRTALKLSSAGEDALDLVTPTVNYHPLLPLKAVEVTYGRCIADIHGSGLYERYVQNAGGIEKVIETLYETQANAILTSAYPCMLGHFFAAHSYANGKYSWFGMEPCHIELMRAGATKVRDACVAKGAFIDLTGIHLSNQTVHEKQVHDGFFHDFQKWFVSLCNEKDVVTLPGSDSHRLSTVGDIEYYHCFV